MKAKKLRCGQSVDIFLKLLKSVELEIFTFSLVLCVGMVFCIHSASCKYIYNSVKLTLSNMFSKN
jgi:hypothetical protein